jgi:hypothetical protein
MPTNYPLQQLFILDSGTTTHITNDPDRIYNYRLPTPGDFIWAGTSRSWIKGYGSITLTLSCGSKTENLVLQDVAICPDILYNLVSFRILRQKGYWWDTQLEPTALMRPDRTTIRELAEIHGQ